MKQMQIDHNYEAALRHSKANNCVVAILCSKYFNSEYEKDRELVGTDNQLTIQSLVSNGFWVRETLYPSTN